MKLNKLSKFLLINALIGLSFIFDSAAQNLPRVSLQGRQFYYYSVKKGDSLYGISKQNDWDIDTLRKYNEKSLVNLKKDTRLYYPVTETTKVETIKTPKGKKIEIPLDPDHIVQKGETIYGISRKYGVSLEDIYSLNPTAKYGIKEGEKLKLPQTLLAEMVQYTIQPGDTPYSVAKKHNTSVSDLYKANPGISDKNFKYGHEIIVPLNTNEDRKRVETVKENKLQGFTTYKVKSGENWDAIAGKNGVTKEELIEINEGVDELKKGSVIAIPEYKTVDVQKTYIEEDPREKTESGRNEIYQEVAKERVVTPGEIRIALVLDAPTTRKDLEFSRGMLLSLDSHKNSGFKTAFKIINGTHCQDSILNVFNEYNPNLVISTADNLPTYLSDYAGKHSVGLLNTFDVKSVQTENNPNVIQLLTPSETFTTTTSRYIADNFGKRKFIFIGDTDKDEIAQSLIKQFDSSKYLCLTQEEMIDYPFYDTDNYLVYCTLTDRNEISRILDKIIEIRQNAPLSEISVVGRPSWITLADNLKEKFSEADVYFPSRFYFDTADGDSKQFMSAYRAMFNHPPYKSYPIYSVTGYDVGNYFYDAIGRNGGDFSGNMEFYPTDRMLQNDICLSRQKEGSGLINTSSYLIRFMPGQVVDKIRITE